MMFGKSVNETKAVNDLPSFLEPEPVPVPPPAPKPVDKIDTIIGEGTRILGTIHCKTLLRVDGIVEGDVLSDSKVVISEKGLVKGNVTAECFTLGGELTGNAKVREKTEILATGKLFGDIITKILIMDENAILDGKCTMSKAAETLKRDVLPDLPEPKASVL